MSALNSDRVQGKPSLNERWEVEFHDEFLPEIRQLSQTVREKLKAAAIILSEDGPPLGRPFADTLKGSRHANMKELRFDADGGAWRVAYAFDPNRKAILLVAGDKSGAGKVRFYRNLIRTADMRFDKHLQDISLKGAVG
jgi:hypothetical protein